MRRTVNAHVTQVADEHDACATHEVAYRICGCPIPGSDVNGDLTHDAKLVCGREGQT